MTEQLHEFFKTQANLDYFISQLSEKSIKSILSDLKIKTKTVKPPIELNENDTLIFTDGSAINNGKTNVKAAFSVFFNEPSLNHLNNTEIMSDNLSNNGAELSAILYALKTVNNNKELFANKKVIVISDSLYSIKCITGGWSKKWIENGWLTSKKEPVKNKELIQEILEYNSNLNVAFKHVFSHQPAPNNTDSIEYLLWKGNDIVDKNCSNFLTNF
jgi:ribonuclease HI